MNSKRIENILELMEEASLDYFLISDPESIAYCTDYYNNPYERMFVLMISKHGDHKLFCNQLFYIDHDLGIDIIWHQDGDDAIQTIVDHMTFPNRIGIDKNWPAKFLLILMKKLPKAKFINASPCVDLVRMKKDNNEQVLMIEASRINDLAMQDVINLCKKGLSEIEISQKLPDIYRKYGAEGISFEPTIAFGKNGADPHHGNDSSVPHETDSITIDMGCKYKGYCSDMTRTIFYGAISEKQIEVYELVKKANEAAEKMIRPGVKLADIDKCARDIITEAGYGPNFNHRLGHFIGREVHEYGDVSQKFDMVVEEGMVFSIEPGVYLPNEFGVRIEDLVLVTEDGCRVLNSFSKDILII